VSAFRTHALVEELQMTTDLFGGPTRLVLTSRALHRHARRAQRELQALGVALNLTGSQEFLARTLGLKNWHEVLRLVEAPPPSFGAPAEGAQAPAGSGRRSTPGTRVLVPYLDEWGMDAALQARLSAPLPTHPGSLSLIVGAAGSGKSLFLATLLQERMRQGYWVHAFERHAFYRYQASLVEHIPAPPWLGEVGPDFEAVAYNEVINSGSLLQMVSATPLLHLKKRSSPMRHVVGLEDLQAPDELDALMVLAEVGYATYSHMPAGSLMEALQRLHTLDGLRPSRATGGRSVFDRLETLVFLERSSGAAQRLQVLTVTPAVRAQMNAATSWEGRVAILAPHVAAVPVMKLTLHRDTLPTQAPWGDDAPSSMGRGPAQPRPASGLPQPWPRAPHWDELYLPPALKPHLARRGLTLVGGPPQSGRSTVLAAAFRTALEALNEKTDSPMGKPWAFDGEAPFSYEGLGLVAPVQHPTLSPTDPLYGATGFPAGGHRLARRRLSPFLVDGVRDLESMREVLDTTLTGHTLYVSVEGEGVLDILRRLMALFPAPEQVPRLWDVFAVLRTVVALRGQPERQGGFQGEYLRLDRALSDRVVAQSTGETHLEEVLAIFAPHIQTF
jgi:hypothetical protein